MNLVKLTYFLIFLASVIFLNACGSYSFRGSNPPEGIRSVTIPQFENNSGFSDANILEYVTKKLKDVIISDNTFRLADPNSANGLVKGVIVNVKDDPLVVGGNETVSKRRITVTANVTFQNLVTQKKIWDKPIEDWGEYDSSDNSFSARDSGIKTALDKLATDILIEMNSNW
ncbi:hypothetical protein BH10BAC5_BH10BAC5_08130 [soil metagenome]